MEDEQSEYILDIFERALEIVHRNRPDCFSCSKECINYGAMAQACADIAIEANRTEFANNNLMDVLQSCLH